MASARNDHPGGVETERTRRASLVRAHGADSISCSTMQPGLSYFETSFGYVAYRRAFGFDLTLGPPVCAAGDRPALIERFLGTRRRPLFFYLPKEVAVLVAELAGRRFRTCGMGIEKVIPLGGPADADLHPRVRGALKKAARAQLELSEVRPSHWTEAQRARADAITRSYLTRSAVPVEMSFLNRPLGSIDWRDDGLSRTFLLRQGTGGETFGYIVLDPYFDGGRVTGYLLNLIRFEPTRLWGVYYAAVAALAARLRGERIAELSLGFCPLVGVETEGCSPFLARQVRWMERRFAEVSYLARLREMKEAFPGRTLQRYFVSPSPWAASALLALVRACGVPLAGMIGPQLLRAIVPRD
jgi:lysylphosphatidylglycerol synthetase-like protein (DUF2156 family)